MAQATGPDGTEAHLRAIVFRDGDLYVAQCIDYDIAVQAADVPAVLDRLQLTLEAEHAVCAAKGQRMCDCLVPAPNYYHELWAKRSNSLTQHSVPAPVEIAFTAAA